MRIIYNTTILIVAMTLAAGLATYLQQPSGGKATSGDAHSHGKHEQHAGDGVKLSDAQVAAAGIELEKAGPGELHDSLLLNGILQPNQETLVQVTPRFPGIAREIRKRVGDRVEKGELLAKIESNQSLTVYELRAPLAGTIIDRQVALGEHLGEQKACIHHRRPFDGLGRLFDLSARSQARESRRLDIDRCGGRRAANREQDFLPLPRR
jgi:cobalt-zinc-cadmium efflux system membrane fusion protein